MDSSSLQLRVKLEDEHLEKFEELKKKLSITTNTEMVRYIISETWEREFSDFPFIEINPELNKVISLLLQREDVKSDYHTYTVTSFVNKAIEHLISTIEGQKKSILDWDIKSKLSEEQLEIALAFGRCFRENSEDGVTAQQIADELGRRNKEKVCSILDDFVMKFVLESINPRSSEKLYFVS